MAGDWNPLRTNLRRDPRTFRMATMLGVTTFDMVGRLHEFWSWAQDHTLTGDLPDAAPALVDAVVELEGFSEAMVQVGWLEFHDGGVVVPGFAEWNDKGAKRRLMEAQRKREARSKGGESASTGSLAAVSASRPQSVRKMSACDADKHGTTGQDRTVTPPPSSPSETPPPRGGPDREPTATTATRPKRPKAQHEDWRSILQATEFAFLREHPGFIEAWEEWLAFRREQNFPVPKPRSTRKVWRSAKPHGAAALMEAIDESMGATWRRLFPEHFGYGARSHASRGAQGRGGGGGAQAAIDEYLRRRGAYSAAESKPRDVTPETPESRNGHKDPS